MKFDTYLPTKHLSQVVKFYWSLERAIPSKDTYIHRTFANHCPELIFHYGGTFNEILNNDIVQSTFKTGVHGQTNKIRNFTAKNSCGIFGVMLQPYAIPVLFNVPVKEIKDELIDLSLLLGQRGNDLSEQIILAKNNLERKDLIDHYLSSKFSGGVKDTELIHAIRLISLAKGNVNIKDISQKVYLSQRQFERRFKEMTGFTPKSFSRIVRFKSLLANYQNRDLTLTEIAYDFGYYDQSHFIQEFKQFTGYKPKTYFDGKAFDVFYSPR